MILGHLISYFGMQISTFSNNFLSPNTENSSTFLLLNTEFKFDTNLNGYEVFAANSGYVKICVSYFNFLVSIKSFLFK